MCHTKRRLNLIYGCHSLSVLFPRHVPRLCFGEFLHFPPRVPVYGSLNTAVCFSKWGPFLQTLCRGPPHRNAGKVSTVRKDKRFRVCSRVWGIKSALYEEIVLSGICPIKTCSQTQPDLRFAKRKLHVVYIYYNTFCIEW